MQAPRPQLLHFPPREEHVPVPVEDSLKSLLALITDPDTGPIKSCVVVMEGDHGNLITYPSGVGVLNRTDICGLLARALAQATR